MKDYFRYWGKALKGKDDIDDDAAMYHLLVYHCLDVAAVGQVWWQHSKVIREHFVTQTELSEEKILAWLMFFVALHDLGKFDVRFQLKARDIALHLWRDFMHADESLCHKYYHGNYSAYWLFKDLNFRFDWDSEWGDEDTWDVWKPWILAVAGHHGIITEYIDGLSAKADSHVLEHDRSARLGFIAAMEDLFLKPAGLSLDNLPPPVEIDFLAGFCSVCDWLGSMEYNGNGDSRFVYVNKILPLNDYYHSRLHIARQVLRESGLFHAPMMKGGMAALFPKYCPRLVQTFIDDLPVQSGLSIIEAPTGSGKTEASLAYASRLLADGVAESIIFALPTQATANAMFARLLDVTEKLYKNSNLLLAHGKARFNDSFIDLKNIARTKSPQNTQYETEASIQCSEWLGQSRKRVFLGQVGVCTIDQVLISVLPVKHKFIRSFGLGKSVLIVDEVHAYDSYMYGLLEGVLKKQKQMQGSVILLSATLPYHQKESLLSAWGGMLDPQIKEEPYPLITHVSNTSPVYFSLSKSEQMVLEKTARQVEVDIVEHASMKFDHVLLKQVVRAATIGANVVLICNLVADAQSTAKRLRELGAKDVDIFHSRFRFKDRQQKEKHVMQDYGDVTERKQGGILVATQVVEQSLDLDFDWMLTQLCPMDLFFQRLGRLHRHKRARPLDFELPKCTVLVPENNDYALHKLIYGNKDAPNARILWRTEQLLRQQKTLHFPDVYRPMIESVYQEDIWLSEPEDIQQEYKQFEACEEATRYTSLQLMNSTPNFSDSDSRVALLTRDGEMSLSIIPVIGIGKQKALLEGSMISAIDEWKLLEVCSMNTVPAPASWKRKGLPTEKDGIIWLPMEKQFDQRWEYSNDKIILSYTIDRGLEGNDQ